MKSKWSICVVLLAAAVAPDVVAQQSAPVSAEAKYDKAKIEPGSRDDVGAIGNRNMGEQPARC